MISTRQAATYLTEYITAYQLLYKKLTAPPPHGAGYPDLRISPYLGSQALHCMLTPTGTIIADYSWQPDHSWEVAGGPALMTDYPESRVPNSVIDALKHEGIYGKPIGIYRITSKLSIPKSVWNGQLPRNVGAVSIVNVGQVSVAIERYNIPLMRLLEHATFGASRILDLKIPQEWDQFSPKWTARDLGFTNAERSNRRFFHYLEVDGHSSSLAWDTRTIWARVHQDVRRDFIITSDTKFNGKMSLPGLFQGVSDGFFNRLNRLANAIDKFETLLKERGDDIESVFHNFLLNNPVILDVYGEIEPKPKFMYPEGSSPLDKKYVEPDFLIRYGDNSYKLVEIERPSKHMITNQGHPRSEVTQAAHQTAEWKAYIRNHYDQIRTKYPGISTNHRTMLVISRSTAESFGGHNMDTSLEQARLTYRVDELLLYDHLLERAKAMYVRLSTLSQVSVEPDRVQPGHSSSPGR